MNIDVDHLSFSYDGPPVLRDVSFTVPKGQFVGIIGPNGGGKTTLLKLMMGFLKPSWGKISIFGKSPKEARSLIGWVPQHFNFDPQFPISVMEVVLGGRLRGSWRRFSKEDRSVALEALEKMGIKQHARAAFSDLSGGQMQRVLIARALASQPKLLMLDEPTASVDVTAQNEIYQTLQNLRGEVTMMMVTHDLQTAVNQVDTILCLQTELSTFAPSEVCEHFAMGLYHPPLKGK